jgi:hypothetical protein
VKDEILRRIERELGVPDIAERLGGRIQQADLHSLLLEVFRRRAEARTPADVLADYRSNRFVTPSPSDPRMLARFDAAAFAALPSDFEALELSPVSPLGTSSVLATVHQDKVLASIRSVEVLSDATNVLALECAVRRKKSQAPVNLAASHRHLRASFFSGPHMFAHFRIFGLCSAGRDSGEGRFHLRAVTSHLRFYAGLLTSFMGPDFAIRFALTDLASESPRDVWRLSFPRVEVTFDQSRESGRGYYHDVCFKIHARDRNGEWLELGDGGGVDWTAKLLSNAKERTVISGISSERICALMTPARV